MIYVKCKDSGSSYELKEQEKTIGKYPIEVKKSDSVKILIRKGILIEVNPLNYGIVKPVINKIRTKHIKKEKTFKKY